jgi:hypothetical protein
MIELTRGQAAAGVEEQNDSEGATRRTQGQRLNDAVVADLEIRGAEVRTTPRRSVGGRPAHGVDLRSKDRLIATRAPASAVGPSAEEPQEPRNRGT